MGISDCRDHGGEAGRASPSHYQPNERREASTVVRNNFEEVGGAHLPGLIPTGVGRTG